jgi:hypothetical protein
MGARVSSNMQIVYVHFEGKMDLPSLKYHPVLQLRTIRPFRKILAHWGRSYMGAPRSRARDAFVLPCRIRTRAGRVQSRNLFLRPSPIDVLIRISIDDSRQCSMLFLQKSRRRKSCPEPRLASRICIDGDG